MNPMFKRKLIYTIPVYLILALLALYAGRSISFTLGLLTSFSVILIILFFKYQREFKTPTHFADERATMIAYKADSIALRILLVTIALLFFMESLYGISTYVSLYMLTGTLLGIGMILKVGLFYYLNWKN